MPGIDRSLSDCRAREQHVRRDDIEGVGEPPRGEHAAARGDRGGSVRELAERAREDAVAVAPLYLAGRGGAGGVVMAGAPAAVLVARAVRHGSR